MNTTILTKYLPYLAIVIIAAAAAVWQGVPLVTGYISTQEEISVKKDKVADLERKVDVAKKAQQQEKEAPAKEEKLIFQSEIKNAETDVYFNEMYETVLSLAKQTGIKVRSMKFTDAPESDPIKRDHSSSHTTTLLKSEFIGSYTQLQNFLREIYRHQYLMGINSLDIVPYEFEKKVLIIDMELILYAKK